MGEGAAVNRELPIPTPEYAAGGIISLSPLVTISKVAIDTPMGIAPFAPYLASIPSLNFVGLSWTCESPSAAEGIRDNMRRAIEILPLAHFVILANTEAEAWLLSRLGVPNLLANELIFVDENLYAPPPVTPPQEYDASYVARLLPFKRHHLAADISSLLLLYGPPSESEKSAVEEVLPQAHFQNHSTGAYCYYNADKVAATLSRAATGLALSAEEGSMRAFMESLLCGLPVVTTPSRGGRARYAYEPYVITSPPDSSHVARAVEKLVAANHGRAEVRASALHQLEIERRRFTLSLEPIFMATVGRVDCIDSFEPFRGKAVKWSKTEDILKQLASAV